VLALVDKHEFLKYALKLQQEQKGKEDQEVYYVFTGWNNLINTSYMYLQILNDFSIMYA